MNWPLSNQLPRPRVLVIDDERSIALGVKLRLEHSGCKVDMAHDGVEGLDAIASLHPDLVLLDVRMPRMDGLEVLRRLHQDPDETPPPVIMLSASLQDEQVALDAGAEFFLTKPYRSTDLLEAMSTALGAGVG